jgi:hypothetical protein
VALLSEGIGRLQGGGLVGGPYASQPVSIQATYAASPVVSEEGTGYQADEEVRGDA